MYTPPPRAQSVTPTPTIPPPEGTPSERLERRIKPWQAIAAAALFLFTTGAALGAIRSSLVSKDELAEEHRATTANVITIQTEAISLRERVIRTESAVVSMQRDVSETQRGVQFLTAQLIEIAKTTGAKQVPAPTPTAQPP